LEGYFWSHWNIHTYCYIDNYTNTFKHKECKTTFFRSYTNNIIFIHKIKPCSSHLGLLNYSSCTTKVMVNTIQINKVMHMKKTCMHTNWNKVLQMSLILLTSNMRLQRQSMGINLPNSQHSKNPIHILKWVPTTNKFYKKNQYFIVKP
jgi:hypothetical protein